jgi:flagella basal body P-ring formation protein FlgA
MRYIELAFVLLYIALFGHYYQTLMPVNPIPAGHVIQAGDFQPQGFRGSTEEQDWLTVKDSKAIIGHKALKDLRPNNYVHLADIQ